MADKVQLIKEWVENLKNQSPDIPSLGTNALAGFQLACDDVIAFIDSLTEEPAGEDLEEEYEKYFKAHETDIVLNPYTNCKKLARHFAEWQKQRMMKENKVLFEKSSGGCSKELIDIIDKEFGITGRDENNNPLNGYGDWQCGMILNGPSICGLVKLGAKWQKQKDFEELLKSDMSKFKDCYEKGRFDMREEMMKNAIELAITNTSFIPLPKMNIKAGDKVKIIIVKEGQQ